MLFQKCKRNCLSNYSYVNNIEARSQDAVSCTQLPSYSLICKLSLWFQYNSTEEWYDTNRIVWTGLY